jgi:hypothetical protein
MLYQKNTIVYNRRHRKNKGERETKIDRERDKTTGQTKQNGGGVTLYLHNAIFSA